MLVEKKIQLTKEMKDALDPNYGGAEIEGMKNEISRMELRLKQLYFFKKSLLLFKEEKQLQTEELFNSD
jgi:hypothetical protein